MFKIQKNPSTRTCRTETILSTDGRRQHITTAKFLQSNKNYIGGVIASVYTSSAVDCGHEPWSGQTWL